MLEVVPRAYRAFSQAMQASPTINNLASRALARLIRHDPDAIDAIVREIGLARVWDAVDRLTVPASK
jgi:hypothetical protein